MLKSYSYDTDNFNPKPDNSSAFTLKTVSGTALCFNEKTEELKTLNFDKVKGSTKSVKIKMIDARIKQIHGKDFSVIKVKELKDVARKGHMPLEAVWALVKFDD